MKRLILISLPLFVLTLAVSLISNEETEKLAESNKFNVINVQGRIVFLKSGEEMKRGDVYLSGTKLDFESNASRAAIVNKLRGRFVLTGNTKGKIKILPAANNISSRSGALLNVLDLKKHFDGRYLILKRSEVQISKASFPMDNDTFFYLTYEHNGEEIAKKLRHEDDFLILDKHEIFKVDGNAIPVKEKEMTLYYRENGKGTKINTFTPVFANNDELIDEVGLLLKSFEGEDARTKINEVTAHLIDFHGTPHNGNLKSWLKAEFNLESK